MRVLVVPLLLATAAHGGEPFVAEALKMRSDMILHYSPPLINPVPAPAPRRSLLSMFGGSRYPWHLEISTTVFWCGEPPSPGSPSNRVSAWDRSWVYNAPIESPFYCALPYNDVEAGHTRPEAASVVPWFNQAYVRDGQTVLEGKWIAIRHGNRVCYAQWRDVGPFQVDHWQYVFGNERPRPNRNQDAGLDLSPAVRDWLGLETN